MLTGSFTELFKAFTGVEHLIAYVKARLNEKSTYAGIGAVITGAAALSAPYSWIAIGVGVIGVLVPTGKAAPDSAEQGNNE